MSKGQALGLDESFVVRRTSKQAFWIIAGCAMVMIGLPIGTSKLDQNWRGAHRPSFSG